MVCSHCRLYRNHLLECGSGRPTEMASFPHACWCVTVEMGAPHGGGPHEDERGTSMSLQSEPRASINSEQCLAVAPVPCDAFPAFASVIRHLLVEIYRQWRREEGRAISHVVLVLFVLICLCALFMIIFMEMDCSGEVLCLHHMPWWMVGLRWADKLLKEDTWPLHVRVHLSTTCTYYRWELLCMEVVSDIGSVSLVQQHGHDLEYDRAYIRFKIIQLCNQ